MDTEQEKNPPSNYKQIEVDFAYLWLAKFAQVTLAILPGILLGLLAPHLFLTLSGFAVIAITSLATAFILDLTLGKIFTSEKESHLPLYLVYLLAFVTLNILNLNNISPLASNLTLTALIAIQSARLKNFRLPLFALGLSYITSLFYSVLPQSTKFASIHPPLAFELLILSAIFIIYAYCHLVLAGKPKAQGETFEHEKHAEKDNTYLNIGITVNATAYAIFFGLLFAGNDLNKWGIALGILAFMYFIIGLIYQAKLQSSHAICWFLTFGLFSFASIYILLDRTQVIIGWELTVLIIAALSQLPNLRKLKLFSLISSQIIFLTYLLTEPFASQLHLKSTLNIPTLIIITILFYSISRMLRDPKVNKKDSYLITTLEAILILIFSIPLLLSNSLISVSWALIGFGLIIFGFPLADYSLRLGGLLVLFVTILKILLVDAAGLSTNTFIIPLIIISPILIITGLIYQKFRKTGFQPNASVTKIHQLTTADAAERIEGLTGALEKKYANLFSNLSRTWNEDHDVMSFSLDSYGFHVVGRIGIYDGGAVLDFQLPTLALPFKNIIIRAIEKEVGELLETEPEKA